VLDSSILITGERSAFAYLKPSKLPPPRSDGATRKRTFRHSETMEVLTYWQMAGQGHWVSDYRASRFWLSRAAKWPTRTPLS
jgi:hypothetical protein